MSTLPLPFVLNAQHELSARQPKVAALAGQLLGVTDAKEASALQSHQVGVEGGLAFVTKIFFNHPSSL